LLHIAHTLITGRATPNALARDTRRAISTRAKASALTDAYPSFLKQTKKSGSGYRVLAQMQVELLVHLVYRDALLQAARIMFHCAFDTEDANPFIYLSKQSQ
jgi:hypothetical protein